MTNLEGRVLLRKQAMAPPEGVRSDLEMLAALAERLGRGEFFSSDPRDRLHGTAAGERGRSRRLRGHHLRTHRGGGRRLLALSVGSASRHAAPVSGQFPDGGRARAFPSGGLPACRRGADRDYPLYLTTGRVMAHYQSGTQTRRVKALRDMAPQAFVELHPDLAKRLGHRERRSRPGRDPARNRRPESGDHPDHSPGHAVRAVPLGRRRLRQSPDQPCARPDLPHAGVQSLRRPHRIGASLMFVQVANGPDLRKLYPTALFHTKSRARIY